VACYKITWKKSALKELKTLEKKVIRNIIQQIESLKVDPRPKGCKKIKGFYLLYRIRKGNYRIIYSIKDDQLIIEIIRIGHRKNIYHKKML